MGLGSSKIHVPQSDPETLCEFKKLAITPEQYSIPEVPAKREVTDRPFLIIFILCFLLLFGFMIYSFAQTDSLRFENGFDDCGNVCGEKNEFYSDINCTGKDYREATFLLYEDGQTTCVKECDPEKYRINGNKCHPRLLFTEEFEELGGEIEELENKLDDLDKPTPTSKDVLKELEAGLGSIFLALFISAMVALGLLMLFKYAVGVIIWGIIGTCYGLLTGVTLYAVIMEEFNGQVMVLIIIWVIVSIVLMFRVKRIPLVINIFREAMVATFALPGLILTSFLILLVVFAWTMIFLVTAIELCYAGVLTPIGDNHYTYMWNGAIIFTIFFLIFMTIWIYNFLSACQAMIISGAVSSWYFSRDKSFLGSPVKDSFKNLVKFHIGTVAFGSLIIAIIHNIKFWLWLLSTNRKTRPLAVRIMRLAQTVLVYICRNAYIETAMHGESFLRSGKRAVQLIYGHLNDVMTLNSIAGFVLIMSQLLVGITTLILCRSLLDNAEPASQFSIIMGMLLGLMLGHYVFDTIAITIDTIYLCYCEDCVINDGLERPYYMSVELMQFVDETKGVMTQKEVVS